MGDNWYEIKQNHNLGYKLTFICLKILPSVVLRFISFPIGFFYWVFSKKQREFSKNYGNRFLGYSNAENVTSTVVEKSFSTLNHFLSFALNLIENVQAWAGKFKFENVHWQEDDVSDLVQNIDSGKGTVLLISHLGNAQMLKGLATIGESGTQRKMSITTISDANVSAGFNALLMQVNKDSAFHLVNSNNIGPETILLLQERLEKGEVVVIAGDRVSANTDRSLKLNFLGKEADFPYGVFVLISLLNAPTYFVNGLRHSTLSLKTEYDMFVKKNPVSFDCGRKERNERIVESAKNYAENLEKLTLTHPYQWYNFFDFWRSGENNA